MSWVVFGVSLVSLAVAGPRADVSSFLRGDFDKLSRAAARDSAADHLSQLANRDPQHRTARLASVHSAPFVVDAWLLLSPLAQQAVHPDRAIAVAGARSAVRIAQQVDRDYIMTNEIPQDELVTAAGDWSSVWKNRGLWPDVRVLALETAVSLRSALRETSVATVVNELAAEVLQDPDAELRLAVLQLMPDAPTGLRDTLLGLVRTDSPTVAAESARLLCDAKQAKQVAAALQFVDHQRLQSFLRVEAIPHLTRAACARCLAAAGGKQHRAAIDKFVASVPRALRKLVRSRLTTP